MVLKPCLKRLYQQDYNDKRLGRITSSLPCGARDIAYPNQEWQVDATRLDFMVVKNDELLEDLTIQLLLILLVVLL